MKNFSCSIFSFIFLLLLGMASCTESTSETNKPNIIIFLVDDMGLMDTSVPFIYDLEGNPVKYPLNSFYRTPEMEKLAEQGTRFTNFYAHSVCSPSRVSILSGQNSARHSVTTWIHVNTNNRGAYGPSSWNWDGLTRESVTLPRLLQEEGYRTIHVGKAHFGPFGSEGEDPLNIGFDINIGGGAMGRPGSYYGKDGFGKFKGDSIRAVKDLEKYHGTDIFLTEALTLEAKDAITQARDEEKPFFLHMSHYAVHAPFQSDPRFINNYNVEGKNNAEKAYATLVEGIDKSLGDIVAHVKELGIGENTLILFLGDNGSDAPIPMKKTYGSSFPLKGKKAMHWEGGMRVPFIASWITPNDNIDIQKRMPIVQNGVQTQMGSIIDLFPTLCDITNISIPEGYIMDGFNLKEQFSGNLNNTRHERFLNHFPHDHRSSYFTSFVDSYWKIIYHYQVEGQPRYELFNLKSDPFESHNLADENPTQLRIMMEALKRDLEEKHAQFPEVEKQALEVIIP